MKKGMIKANVLYPNVVGKKFDMDYYLNTHVPMVTGLMGDALKGATIESGLGGGAPESPAPYIIVASMLFDSMEEFGAVFGANADKIMSDIPNFTDIEPSVQISEVVVWNG